MSDARTQILNRLRAPERPDAVVTGRDFLSRFDWSREERIERFKTKLESVRAEVHVSEPDSWCDLLLKLCQEKALNNLLLSGKTNWGAAILERADEFPELLHYEKPVESWQQKLFYQTDAALTSTMAGIAETGSLILWPDAEEPRLMSLVPPVHFAIVEVDKLFSTFAEAVQEQGWAEQGMPTNALLISGPSKSADIAQVMAYGVHGPKELVVILV